MLCASSSALVPPLAATAPSTSTVRLVLRPTCGTTGLSQLAGIGVPTIKSKVDYFAIMLCASSSALVPPLAATAPSTSAVRLVLRPTCGVIFLCKLAATNACLAQVLVLSSHVMLMCACSPKSNEPPIYKPSYHASS